MGSERMRTHDEKSNATIDEARQEIAKVGNHSSPSSRPCS